MGGVYDRYPMLALLLAVPLFSLVGIPPLSGFWPKLALISAGWADARPVITGLILVASFLTLVVIARVWAQAFWNERPKGVVPKPGFVHWDALTGAQRRLYLIPIGLLAVVSLYIGFGAGHIERLSTRAATELSNPQLYIEAVFGDRGKGE
jgi:multicomponent Na+:H+ antiporter subunit D